MTWFAFAVRVVATVLGADPDHDEYDEEFSDEYDYEVDGDETDEEVADDEDSDVQEGEGESSIAVVDTSPIDFASVDGAEAEVDRDDPDGESDDLEGDEEEVTVHPELPPVLTDFPSLIPPVGSNYETDLHKKLLVITESPYLTKHSRYLTDEGWYAGNQELFMASGYLGKDELAHLALGENIALGNEQGKWLSGGYRSHTTYESVNDTLKGILGTEGNVLKDEVAYDNFFARPARHGRTLEVSPLDEHYAAEKFRTLWLTGEHKPDVVLISSAKARDAMAANGLGVDILRDHGIESIVTDHPLAKFKPRLGNRPHVVEAVKAAWLKR